MAVAILALGLGFNTAVFSIFDAVLLRALPFAAPDQLVEVWSEDAGRGGMRVPAPLLEALRARARTLESIAIHGPAAGVLMTGEGKVDVRGDRVSANFLQVLGVPPTLGRGFSPVHDRPGAPPVLVASHLFWRRYLGGDTAAIGRFVYLDSIPYTLIGVMPPTFRTKFRGVPSPTFWTTHVTDRIRAVEDNAGYELVARLAPRTTVAQARRDVAAIGATLAMPGWGPNGRRLSLLPLEQEIIRDSALGLKLTLSAVALLLLMVCVNLAMLLLARSERRVLEFATRKAVGASSAQLVRLALAESVLLSLAGGVLGVGLARVLLPILVALAPAEIPRLGEAAIDPRVLGVALGLTFATAGLVGLLPALRLGHLSLNTVLRGGAEGTWRPGRPLRSGLVSAQVSVSVTLCILGGLTGRTFLTLLPTDPGFHAEQVNLVPLLFRPQEYATAADRQVRIGEIGRRFEAIPGVTEVATATNIPFSGDVGAIAVRDAIDSTKGASEVEWRNVSPRYFSVLAIPVLRGRSFRSDDRPNAPGVAIVNQMLAGKLAPAGDVVGRRVRVGGSTERIVEIVGVVGDARSIGTSASILDEVYFPIAQRPASFLYFLIRATMPGERLDVLVRSELRAAAPELSLGDGATVTPLSHLVRRELAGPRYLAMLSGMFSAATLLLTALGVFGLVAHTVAQRRHEFGIRAALGALPRQLATTAAQPAIAVIMAGLAVGLVVAGYCTRFVAKVLYGIRPLDPPTFLGTALLMLLVGGLASFAAARSAMRTDPVAALTSR